MGSPLFFSHRARRDHRDTYLIIMKELYGLWKVSLKSPIGKPRGTKISELIFVLKVFPKVPITYIGTSATGGGL